MNTMRMFIFVVIGCGVIGPLAYRSSDATVSYASQQIDPENLDPSILPEDLEIIRNLDFVENLQLFNEEDFSLFEEAEIGANEKNSI